MISTSRLTEVFVEMADTLVADFDIVEFLHDLTEHAAALSGAEAVGLVLADHRGTLQFMAASNDSGEALELFQLQEDEGPCLDCFRTKEPVINADLGHAESLWPSFAPRARAGGFQAVHAFPMRLRDEAIGALNIFSTRRLRFEADEARVIQSLADVATISILQQRSIARAEAVTEQLQGALNSRIVIEQAKGALSQRESISVDEAFVLLRARARSERRRLLDVAGEVLH
jgi:transcriptional regulator with GAF, ATPase, and Fis domain